MKETSFNKWLRENWEKDNIFPPPLDAQIAIDFLSEELLGKNWYVSAPIHTKQVNTVIVDEIIKTYAHGSRWRRKIK